MSTTNIPSAARSASGLAILLAAVLVVAACASAGGALVAADRAVHLAVSETQDTADHLCDQKVLTPAACQTFNEALVPSGAPPHMGQLPPPGSEAASSAGESAAPSPTGGTYEEVA